MSSRTLCLLTPSVIGRRWLVEVEEKTADEETGEEKIANVVKELAKDKAVSAIERVEQAGFKIVNRERCILSREQARRYLEASGSDCSANVISYLTSGAVIALLLEKENAVGDLIRLLGPEDPEEAREEDCNKFGDDVSKWSLRGAFGTTGARSGLRGSRSPEAAAREISQFFPDSSPRWERTLALVAANDAAAAERHFQLAGLCIIKSATLDTVGRDLRTAYPAIANLGEEDPLSVFAIEGHNAITNLSLLQLPNNMLLYHSTNAEDSARDVAFWFKSMPMERLLLVALEPCQAPTLERLAVSYGFSVLAKKMISCKDIVVVSRHGDAAFAFVVVKAGAESTCQQMISANKDLDIYTSANFGWIFPELDAAMDLDATAAKSFVKKSETRGSTGSQPQLVQSLLVSGLTELCRTKPAGLDAIRQLGKWLLLNNPDRDAATRAEEWLKTRETFNKPAGVPPPPRPTGMRTGTGTSIPVPTDHEEAAKRHVVFVLGAPGSGKGTQCAKLAAKLNYGHISTGELLRREVEQQTPIGQQVAEKMQSGGLVETEVLVELIKKAIAESDSNQILLDGFPRDLEQAEIFESALGAPSMVLNLSVDLEVAKTRLADRQRNDDKPEIIEKRFETYNERSLPVIEKYTKLGKVRTIHQARASETGDQVFERVLLRMSPNVTVLLGADANLTASVAHSLSVGATLYKLLDANALIERHSRTGSVIGRRIKEIQSRGQIVPVEIIIQLLRSEMARSDSATSRFVVTNFPRNMEECAAFETSVCPISRVVHLRTLPSKTHKSFRADVVPLLDFLRTVGRLVEVDTVGSSVEQILSRGIVSSSRYVLDGTSGAASSTCAELATVELEHAMSLQPGNEPFVVNGLPTDPEEAHMLFEHLGGAPVAVAMDSAEQIKQSPSPVLDHLALEGKLRLDTTAKRLLDSELVVAMGAASVDKTVLEQFVREQGFVLVDFTAAIRALPLCAGTWEAQAVTRAANVENQVPTPEYDQVIEDLRIAKVNMVKRMLGSTPGRGVLLVNCDSEAQLLEDLVPSQVIVFEHDATEVARAALIASAGDAEEEPEEEAVLERVSVVKAEQEQVRALAEQLTPGKQCTVIPCGGASRAELLQSLRAPFAAELFALVAPRCPQTNTLSRELAKAMGIVRIKVPVLLRKEVDMGTQAGKVIQQAIQLQRSIPLDTLLSVLQRSINEYLASGAKLFMLDGFPYVTGEGYPFAHDQLFAIEQQVGRVKLCVELCVKQQGGSVPSGDSSGGKVVELFESLQRCLVLNVDGAVPTEESDAAMVDAAVARLQKVHAEEAELARRNCWQPGDGSQEANLQAVLDCFEPKRAEVKAAEEYWNKMEKAENEFTVALEEVVTKMESWNIEQTTEGHLEGPVVFKSTWYDFVFRQLLNLEEASVRHAREEAARIEAERLAAAEEEEEEA